MDVTQATTEPAPPAGWRRLIAPARIAAMALVALFLGWRLSQIGWAEVWRSLPTSPWYYLCFALLYLSLPVSDFLMYRWLWGIRANSFPVFLRKQVFNQAVLEYSGEAMFYVWAKSQPGLTDQTIFRTVRDANILSALCSNLMTLLILAVVVAGGIGLSASDNQMIFHAILVVGVLAALLLCVAIGLRRRLMTLPLATCLGICAIHVARMTVNMALQAAQWHFALPAVSIGSWLLFLAVMMALNRVPFLPTKDLMFAGLAVSLSAHVAAPQTAVVSMFVTGAALSLAASAAVYAIDLLRRMKG